METKNITTEDFIFENMESEYFQGAVYGESAYTYNEVKKGLIQFAKIHVEKALKAASKNCVINSYIKPFYKGARYRLLKEGESYDILENMLMTKVDKNSILNAYNLDDIK